MQRRLVFECRPAFSLSPSCHSSWHSRVEFAWYFQRIEGLLNENESASTHHYCVQVKHGQKVFFKREPNNSKDPNAIVVCTYSRDIIGHLTKDDAAFYSRFLNFDTCVFGALTRSAHGFYKTSMLVEKIIESSKYAIFHQWMLSSIIISQIVQYSRNAYKQYESFANTLTKLCFHYHQNVNTIKYSNCM